MSSPQEMEQELHIGSTWEPRAQDAGEAQKAPVLVYFHANAELCTDIQTEIGLFYECGFQAVLCPEFRGYGWGTGKPSLSLMCPDAEAAFEAAPKILSEAGLQDAETIPFVVSGRSLGAACAVHIAAHFGPDRVAGLLVESGCMSLLDIPMVQQLGMMMPEMLHALERAPEPLRTLEKMQQVRVPTLLIHGDRDEMIPVEQAVAAHEACGSGAKKLLRLRRCGHNDVRLLASSEYSEQLRLMTSIAAGIEPPEALLRVPPPSPGVFALLAKGLRCLPGVRRCLPNEGGPPVAGEKPSESEGHSES